MLFLIDFTTFYSFYLHQKKLIDRCHPNFGYYAIINIILKNIPIVHVFDLF